MYNSSDIVQHARLIFTYRMSARMSDYLYTHPYLSSCRLLRGIWSAQRTIYTSDEEKYVSACGPNEVLVGQTLDVVETRQECRADGVGCAPRVRMCNYTLANRTDDTLSQLNVPCHLVCSRERYVESAEYNGTVTQWVLCNSTQTSAWSAASLYAQLHKCTYVFTPVDVVNHA